MSTVRTPDRGARGRSGRGAQPPGPPPGGEPSKERRPLLIAAAIVAGALAFYVGMLLGTSGDVPANTTVLGVQIGGMSRAEAIATLERDLGPRAAAPIAITAYGEDAELLPGESGLSFDAVATVDEATGRLYSPLSMVQRIFGSHVVDPVVVVDEGTLTERLDAFATDVSAPPVEPELRYKGTTPQVTPGLDGQGLDVPASLEEVAGGYLLTAGPVQLAEVVTEPTVSDDVARATQEGLATTAVSAPVTVRVETASPQIPPEVIAEATTFEPRDGQLVPVLDGELLHDSIAEGLADVETPGRDATFEIDDAGVPQVVPSQVGQGVSDEDLAAAVAGVLDQTGDARTASPPITVRDPALTTEQAEQLGVVEEISSFTQQVNYAEYMAHNLALASEYINGTLLLPGDVFSMNGTTENRDPEGGYMEGYVIGPGHVFEKALGGGLSAATTAVWSAAFFAGLEPVEVQAHSVYISRYVPGLEATVNWDGFDMKFANNTPYGIFIQAYSDETSMTVRMFSTVRYSLIDAEVGEPYGISKYETIYDASKKCLGQSGIDGFTIDVDRVFYQDEQEVERETFTTTYQSAPEVICGEEPAPEPEPEPEPTDEPTDEPTEEPTDQPTEEPTEEPTDDGSGNGDGGGNGNAGEGDGNPGETGDG